MEKIVSIGRQIFTTFRRAGKRSKGSTYMNLVYKIASLKATDAGRPLYEKYGFVKMNDEMQLPKNQE